MTLTTYLNWDTLQIPNNSEISNFHEETPAQTNHYQFFPYSDESFFLSNALFEDYLDPTGGFLDSSSHHQQLIPCTSYDPFISLSNDMLPSEDYCNYKLLPYPKRQKCSYQEQEQQHVHSSLSRDFLNGFVVANNNNTCSLQPEEVLPPPELLCAMPVFKAPQHGTCVDIFQCEKKSNERTISAQSIAARERRRKITEKTQELGKLVPGGPKMNTAEMLNAAAKYVKYLEAQVGMLELMNTLKEDEVAPLSKNLHNLVVSPYLQEKMYSEEKCFVSKEFVISLTNHDDVLSRPTILKDLKQLIGTNVQKQAKQE